MQNQQRNIQKSVMSLQSSVLFCLLNLIILLDVLFAIASFNLKVPNT